MKIWSLHGLRARGACGLVLWLALLSAGCSTGTDTTPVQAPVQAGPVQLRVLAFNDFHGHLRPPPGGLRSAGQALPVPAGGAAYLASAVTELTRGREHHIVVGAGDLIGASPLLSALLHDEPTVEALGLIGLAVSAVGNHEFDRGAAELLRLQGRARFQYLAAGTVHRHSGQPLLPPYAVHHFDGLPVAFIGLTLKNTPRLVVPSGVAGLVFRDEVQTVNALVPELRAQGVEAIVVLIHQGGSTEGGPNECPGLAGPIVRIVEQFHPAVDLVVSGHTHRAYVCQVAGRTLTSAGQHGTLLTAIDLTLDRATRDVVAVRAENHVVHHGRRPDPRLEALMAAAEQQVQPLARRVVGRLAGPLTRTPGPSGESPLGQVVADAQLAATRAAGAQLALMNPGGLRQSLVPDGEGRVRYEDLFAVQPFANHLVTMTLSGAQILALLEQQWHGPATARLLQVSEGFAYRWDAAAPPGRRVLPGSVRLLGRPLDLQADYRVTVNNFLAEGGDRFDVLRQGRDLQAGTLDIQALQDWLQRNPGLAPAARPRIERVN